MIAWPKVSAAVLALVPSLTEWTGVEVFDGPPVTEAVPFEWFSVGFVAEEGSAGDFNQEIGSTEGLNEEVGSVRCELVIRGDDLPQIRNRAIALANSLDAALRADQTLGGALPTPGSTVTLGADFLPTQNASGASVRVAFSVSYSTSTT